MPVEDNVVQEIDLYCSEVYTVHHTNFVIYFAIIL